MSNSQVAALTLAVLAAHLGVLASLVFGKAGAWPMLALNAALALGVLAYVAVHPKAFATPIDWQVVGLAGFEALVLLAAAWAWRAPGLATAGSWAGFAVHFVVSIGAVAFALLFKINRLI